MKIRKEVIIICTVIILLAGYLVLHNSNSVNYRLPVIKALKQKDIASIEISVSNTILVLSNNNDKWAVNPGDYPADEGKVKDIINSSSKINISSLASEAKSYGMYGLDESNRINLRVFSRAGVIRELGIGDAAPTGQHTYILLKNNPDVYLASGNFRPTFAVSLNVLRDKDIFKLSGDSITDIILTSGAAISKELVKTVKMLPANPTNTNLVRTDIWTSTTGEKINQDNVKNLAEALSTLNCGSFLDSSTNSYYLEKSPVYNIKFTADRVYSLKIFAREGNIYPASCPDIKGIFTLYQGTAENIMKKDKDLLGK